MPRNVYMLWNILELANAADLRRQRIAERRRVRRLFRDSCDPFVDYTEEEFLKTYRLHKATVQNLSEDLMPLIPRQRRRDGLTSIIKILITLAFLASGSYQHVVGQNSHHNVAQVSVSRAIRQVINALNDMAIYRKYVKWPMTQAERNVVKAGFYQKFGIPGVLGCIDGTHVALVRPQDHEERFYSRKGYHTLNVMIICDSNLRILCVDASTPGSAHDSVVWNSHPLSAHLNNLHDNGEHMFLLGDSGYPLRKTMMTPILNTVEGTPEHNYYQMQVSTRNVVERCIGVLKSRFRCLLLARTLHYNPITAGRIVNACAVLHNIALTTGAPEFQTTPEETQFENEMQNIEEPQSSGDSGDESGSEPESPSDKRLHTPSHLAREWDRDEDVHDKEPQASTSSTHQEADSSKPSQPSMPKLLPKMDLPGGAIMYPQGMLAGLEGLGSNLGIGNLAMGYPHSFILGLANQGQEGASSSSSAQQYITIPLSMAMAAAANSSSNNNGCTISASSDDSSELQDLSTHRK